jgi:drug/metabolite transporter (DMT)-like permease
VLGVFLSLVSAAMFAFNNASARRGVLTGSVIQALTITVPIGVPMFFIVAAVSGNLGKIADFSPHALGFLAVAGILHFVIGRYGNVRASKAIGLTLSAPIVQINYIVTLILAVAVLGEQLTLLRILGIALVILGAALMRQAEAKPDDVASVAVEPGQPEKFRPHYAEGYFFALLCAAGYGVTPVLVRAAIGNGGPGAAIAAGVVSYGAASVLLLLILLWPGLFRHAIATNRVSAKWFTYSGIFVCVSQMLMYVAYSVAPLSVVVPIQQLSLLFRYLFAYMLTPEHEIFSSRVVVGTVASLLGAAAISASTDLVLSVVTLPEPLLALVRWQWP